MMRKEEAEVSAKRTLALDSYVQKGMSLGCCAQIAGMSKESFMRFLGEHKISIFHYDDESEFVEEMKNA